MTSSAKVAKKATNTTEPTRKPAREASAEVFTMRPPMAARSTAEMKSSTIMTPRRKSVSGVLRRPSSMSDFMATAAQLIAMIEARNTVSSSGHPSAVPSRMPVNRFTPMLISERMIAGRSTLRSLVTENSRPTKNISSTIPRSEIMAISSESAINPS